MPDGPESAFQVAFDSGDRPEPPQPAFQVTLDSGDRPEPPQPAFQFDLDSGDRPEPPQPAFQLELDSGDRPVRRARVTGRPAGALRVLRTSGSFWAWLVGVNSNGERIIISKTIRTSENPPLPGPPGLRRRWVHRPVGASRFPLDSCF